MCIQELDNNIIPVIQVRTALYIYSYPVWNSLLGIGYTAVPVGGHGYNILQHMAIVFQCVNRNSLVDHKRIRELQNYINLKCNTCTCIQN